MIDTRLIQGGKQFGDALVADLAGARDLAIAVAFAKESALATVDIEEWCRPGRRLRLLAGADFALTELELLRRLELTGQAHCRIFHSVGPGIFHPKIYLIDKGARRVVYVGSSNLTRGGLRENVEACLRIEAGPDAAPIREAGNAFDGLFDGEFTTPVTPEFESGYRELQQTMRTAQAGILDADAAMRFRSAESLFLGRYRSRVAVARWLLVTTPLNFPICMRDRIWGRQQEDEVRRYAAGDVFFFHVSEVSRVVAFGMFTGPPFFDDRSLWPADNRGRGVYPWRIRFQPLGQLSLGIPTKEILQELRPGAPAHWFNGFIQQSHTLSEEDFEALRLRFEIALRQQLGGML